MERKHKIVAEKFFPVILAGSLDENISMQPDHPHLAYISRWEIPQAFPLQSAQEISNSENQFTCFGPSSINMQ